MKINWGNGLVIGMAAFMLFIIALGVYMVRHTTDDYEHDYYEKGLSFNADYDREKQVYTDKAQPVIKVAAQQLNLLFTAPAQGTVHLQRPANRQQDCAFAINGQQVSLPTQKLAQGPWQLVIEWQSNHKKYLYKQEVTLP